MLTRLNVREKEKPETARRRFDGQLSVRAWQTPGSDQQTEQRDPTAPWWWDDREAERSTQEFMAMARAKGMIE